MILCGVISRGTTILAKYIQVAGSNMNEFIDKVLEKISATSDESNSYTHGEFMIYYMSQRGITYLAIAQQDIPRENVFKFLEDVMEKFQRYASDSARLGALGYAYDGEFGEVLKNGMRRATPSEIICDMGEDINDVKCKLIQNIESCLDGEEIVCGDLYDNDDLVTNVGTFKRQSKKTIQIQRHIWYVVVDGIILVLKKRIYFRWENKKMIAIAIVGAILLVYIIVSSSCGGPAWPTCV